MGRAGANTVSEVLASGRPAIFVPIPWVQNDEQNKNAKLAVLYGAARIISQKDLSPVLLRETIDEVKLNWQKMASRGNKIRDLDMHAAGRLADLAIGFIK